MTERDQKIASVCQRTIAAHALLHDLPVSIEVRGGVVHITGNAGSEHEQRVLRESISRIKHVNAVWDLSLAGAGKTHPRILDLGCGGKKQAASATGLDKRPMPGVDVIADIERPLPFRDSSFDHVFAVHSLEHLRDIIGVFAEIHRVLKPSGVLHVMVPAAGSVNFLADPTHVRAFNIQTFKFFCRSDQPLRFRPGCCANTRDNVFADLYPVKESYSEENDDAAFFFD